MLNYVNVDALLSLTSKLLILESKYVYIITGVIKKIIIFVNKNVNTHIKLAVQHAMIIRVSSIRMFCRPGSFQRFCFYSSARPEEAFISIHISNNK